MPFNDRGFYRQKEVFDSICNTFKSFNFGNKPFALPERADKKGDYAYEITDDIVESILDSHFFIADLSGHNPGVDLELGLALAFKDPKSIIVITQDSLSKLHFDVRNIRAKQYKNYLELNSILLKAFKEIEKREHERNSRYIIGIRKKLQTDSITLLADYAKLYNSMIEKKINGQPSLFFKDSSFHHSADRHRFPCDSNARVYFILAINELLSYGLMICDYKPVQENNMLLYGNHVTELGWLIIKKTFPRIYKAAYDKWKQEKVHIKLEEEYLD